MGESKVKLNIEVTDEEIEQLIQRSVTEAADRLVSTAYKELFRVVSREAKSAVLTKVVNDLVTQVVEKLGEETLVDQIVTVLVKENGYYSLRERLWQLVVENQSKWIDKVWRAVLNGDIKLDVKVES